MQGLLIADQDVDCRKKMAALFAEAGYNVIVTSSTADVLDEILKNSAQVVLLGSAFDENSAADLIPLLKMCNRRLTIILIAADASLPIMRKLRQEGIFYHALKPVSGEDEREILEAVQCAFTYLAQRS